MTDWQKKYRWTRTIFGDELPTERGREDYVGFDGEEYIGRIFLETAGPTKDLWRWAGSYPRGMRSAPLMPNAGYKPTHWEAAKTVEEYWDSSKSKKPPDP